ncbi:natriuretic peptides B isoform X2 [Hippoglossus hippoglossus]|uniref:natriuretic peptides B isoform X2 n=1 Tax=Hippoglossus hippoglossus TaxID=8267 RepID=UPI00148DED27|nr:natriuretic peptides B isoform X2 [Hippoglossus hippoglossus]XP_035015523.1 natriuretic peptides B isoform X1 [Hippoglossus stenolepis]
MHLSLISLCIILNLQLLSTYPISTGLTDTDMDILNLLLHRLQESFSEQDGLDSLYTEKGGDGRPPQTGLDEAAIKEFFSAKNLKSLRNDSSRRSSGCFGRRMDRIGSMSSLGCNTVGRYSSK